MSWSSIISNAIALSAALIALIAFREARSANNFNHSLQERLEAYEYFPIIGVTIEPDGDRIRILLTNSSSKNTAHNYIIKYTLRILGGEGFSTCHEDATSSGDILPPQTTEEIYPKEINERIAKAIPFLKDCRPEQYSFVLRANVTCSPPLPESEKIHEYAVASFFYDENRLAIRDNPCGA